MSRRIDFLLPLRSSYQVLQHFTEKIYEAFCRKGFTCCLVPPEDHFNIVVNDPPDLTFAINGLPLNKERQLLCDLIKVPHFSWMVDPPYRFYEVLSSPYLLPGCDDRSGCEFLRLQGFPKSYFFPHAVERELFNHPEVSRPYDVILPASYINYRQLRQEWLETFPKRLSEIMDAAIEQTFADDKTSFIHAFLTLYKEEKEAEQLPEYEATDISAILTCLEMYIKGRERSELLKSIKYAKVLVLGDKGNTQSGWETELGDRHPNITLRSSLPFKESLQLMQQSKIVLNPSLKNKEGGHERIFSGMACGALVMTSENIWLKESFTNERDILFYRPWEMESVNDKIDYYLSNEAARNEVVARGQEIVLSKHTWDARVDSLLKVFSP